jgi:hypothetical protein
MMRLASLIALVVVAMLGTATLARADGDPASDYLATSNIYLPYAQPPAQAVASALASAVENVYVHHYRVKVAVIANEVDLGSVPSLFDKPTEYAHFLGAELQSFYVGPLLIVMPTGFGIYDGGRSTAAEQAVLARETIRGTTGDALTQSATTAVDDLLAARALASKDVLAPFAEPGLNVGHLGKPMRLSYNIFEDSGYAAVRLQVVVGHRTLATFKRPLRRVLPTKTYSVPWRVPAALPSRLPQLCVSAEDGSGNRARRSCSVIQIR